MSCFKLPNCRTLRSEKSFPAVVVLHSTRRGGARFELVSRNFVVKRVRRRQFAQRAFTRTRVRSMAFPRVATPPWRS